MRIAGIVAIAVSFGLSLAAPRARADNKAWTAARLGLPADARVVIGIDFTALRKTQLFATLVPRLIEKADGSKMIETMKTVCKRDPIAMIQGVVIATSEDSEHGAVYLSLAGIDRAKLSSCMQIVAQRMADPTTKITVKHDGNITEISDGTETMYLGWVGKDVVVVPIDVEDRAAVAKWIGGKGALGKSAVGKKLAKVNTSAALWAVSDAAQEVQNVTVKGGHGVVTFAKGNLDADLHAAMDSPAQATTTAASVQQQLDDARQAFLLPPTLGAVLRAITITAAGDEVVIKASIPEGDVVNALNLALELAGP
jgi:hypothetical protein